MNYELIYKYFFLISFTKTKANIVFLYKLEEEVNICYDLNTEKLQYLIPNENFHLHRETVCSLNFTTFRRNWNPYISNVIQ